MSYCDRPNVEDIFGIDNVIKWADLDNNRVAESIQARVDWACARATVDIDAQFRGSRYKVPFVAPYDSSVVHLTAIRAGLLLHDNRGVTANESASSDPFAMMRKEFTDTIKKVKRGVLRFDLVDNATLAPQVLPEE